MQTLSSVAPRHRRISVASQLSASSCFVSWNKEKITPAPNPTASFPTRQGDRVLTRGLARQDPRSPVPSRHYGRVSTSRSTRPVLRPAHVLLAADRSPHVVSAITPRGCGRPAQTIRLAVSLSRGPARSYC